jgi:hypothetical protein
MARWFDSVPLFAGLPGSAETDGADATMDDQACGADCAMAGEVRVRLLTIVCAAR